MAQHNKLAPLKFHQPTLHSPFLHFTVGFTGVVHKACQVAHAVPIDDLTTVDVEAVVVAVLGILLRHATTEFLRAHHFSQILQNDSVCTKAGTKVSTVSSLVAKPLLNKNVIGYSHSHCIRHSQTSRHIPASMGLSVLTPNPLLSVRNFSMAGAQSCR